MLKFLSILLLLFSGATVSFSQSGLSLCIHTGAATSAVAPWQIQITASGTNTLAMVIFTSADTCIAVPYYKNTIYNCRLTGGDAVRAAQLFSTDTITPGQTLQLQFKYSVKNLEMATVINKAPYFKGDTLIIPVDSVKTRPHAAASELMNKIPGIDADAGGNISVNGKKVDEITVNGQSLFGGNAKATLEAIKSNMIQQLEIVEKENSNGQTRAYMNLKLKKNRDNGWYGNAEIQGGNERTHKADLRINHISPGRFVNIFVNSNNLNEKALSEQNLFTFTNLFKRDVSAYSITAQQTQGAISYSSNEDNLFADDSRDFGRNKNHSAGISFTSTVKKKETSAFMITEKAEQYLEESRISRKYLSSSIRLDSSKGVQRRDRLSAFGNLTHSIRISDYDQFKTGITMVMGNDQRTLEQQQQNNLLNNEEQLLSRSTLEKNEDKETRRAGIIHQLSWLHRYKRPAKVFSLYAKWTYQQTRFNYMYHNQLPVSSSQPGNNQYLEHNRNYLQYELQGIHSFPLNKKLLLEIQATHQLEMVHINQHAWAYQAGQEKYSQALPGISATPFKVNTRHSGVMANLLYKTTYTTIIGGLGLNQWSSRRSLNQMLLNNPGNTGLMPYFLFKQRLKKSGNTLTLRYKKAWADPLENQLNPLDDSSSVQQVNTGNPYLESVIRHAASAGYTRNISSGQVFSASIQYSQVNNPVVGSSLFLPAPAIKNSFTQYGLQQQFTGSLFWLDYKNSRPFSYFSSVVAGWQQSYALNNGIPFSFRAFLSSFYLGGRYKINKNMEVDMRLQSIFNAYASAQENRRGDLRSSIRLKMENSFKKEIYTLLSADIQVNGANTPEQKISPFISVEISKYFSQENRWRIIAGVKNLLNTGSAYTFSQNSTQQTANRFNNLPRLFTLGITCYFEKWAKETVPAKRF